jgi:hypothetical protein
MARLTHPAGASSIVLQAKFCFVAPLEIRKRVSRSFSPRGGAAPGAPVDPAEAGAGSVSGALVSMLLNRRIWL